ncbi:MAG: hypothetical protein V7K14_29650 [Nostoc sp.]|uniref:hypothetical protein n=1 Tax=unclassified Nostoc TaxID=2593658 RepID=UPI0025E6DF98|nr:hypothetical protein [Nostoc sp. NMS7]MBN3947429.1 hypothetical protein [Nostoc sp. NMS7]
MNLSVTTSPAKIAPKLSYDVLIEYEQDGSVSATGEHLNECKKPCKTSPQPSPW